MDWLDVIGVTGAASPWLAVESSSVTLGVSSAFDAVVDAGCVSGSPFWLGSEDVDCSSN